MLPDSDWATRRCKSPSLAPLDTETETNRGLLFNVYGQAADEDTLKSLPECHFRMEIAGAIRRSGGSASGLSRSLILPRPYNT
jgi:hypothetical protein